MIFSENGHVKIEGVWIDVIADVECLLQSFYQKMSDELGEEMANKTLVKIGRRAVMTDEELLEELKNSIMDLAVR